VSPFASLDKVANGIKDILTTIDVYLLPFINGDFSLAENQTFN